MALQMTDYSENMVINRFFRAQAFTPPTAVYLALYTSATSETGGGTEATGGSYSRKPIALTPASLGEVKNATTIAYTNMPAQTYTHAAIMDATTGGNMLWQGTLTTPKTTVAGQSVEVAPDELVLGFTPTSSATTWLRNIILDHMLRNQAYTPPANVYQAIYTSPTAEDGSGTEVTGGAYARAALTLNPPTNGVTSNSVATNFTSMPALTATHSAIHDALLDGNMMLQRALVNPVVNGANDSIRFNIGDVTYTVQ